MEIGESAHLKEQPRMESSETEAGESDAGKSALTRRVNRAAEEPREALAKGWHQDPEFCRCFFDRCEDLALAARPESVELARRAVEMAVANGDRCLVNASEGLLAHAYLSRSDRFWAGRTLEQNSRSALACCPRCRSGHLHRLGDVLAEERKPAEALAALNECVAEARGELDGDALGRVLFPRSVAHHFDGRRDQALEDAGRVLDLLSLGSPRGFFLDTAACIGVYVGGGDPRHDALALEILEALNRRIAKLPWKDARTRVSWVEGHLQARLGNVTRASDLLEIACRKLLVDGLPREIVASVLDFAQLKCRPANVRDDNVRAAIRWLEKCLAKRDDLPPDHRRGLLEMVAVLRRSPESAFPELGDFRRSFVAPVPGLLGERIGPDG
jgi:hypothetical protein